MIWEIVNGCKGKKILEIGNQDEWENFTRFFPKSRIYVANHQQRYIVANLAKGGVVKVFDR